MALRKKVSVLYYRILGTVLHKQITVLHNVCTVLQIECTVQIYLCCNNKFCFTNLATNFKGTKLGRKGRHV
jgi:hypothetical protein